MRLLRSAVPAVALAVWLAVSFAQEPPAAPEPQPAPADEAPPPAAREPAPPGEQEEPDTPAAGDEADDVFIPTEELQPDAAVTFPVDI